MTSGHRREQLRLVVVAGIPRCGTTLLASLLNAQEGCTFFGSNVSAFEQVADVLRIRWDERLDEAQRRTALLMVRDGMLRLHHPVLLDTTGFETLKQLHDRVMADLAEPGDIVVGYKTTLDGRQLRRLLGQTSTTCILVYRDPRDAALSWQGFNGGGVERYLRSWREMVSTAVSLRHPRLALLRYEDLVLPPHEALTKLEAVLGMQLASLSANKLHTGVGEIRWTGNSARGEIVGLFDGRSVGRWRSQSTSEVVRYANWVCRREIAHLGYPRANAPSSLRERARFAVRQEADRVELALAEGAHWLSRKVIRRLSPPMTR